MLNHKEAKENMESLLNELDNMGCLSKHVGHKLFVQRKRLGLTRKLISKAFGVSEATWVNWELGVNKSRKSINNLNEVIDFLKEFKKGEVY